MNSSYEYSGIPVDLRMFRFQTGLPLTEKNSLTYKYEERTALCVCDWKNKSQIHDTCEHNELSRAYFLIFYPFSALPSFLPFFKFIFNIPLNYSEHILLAVELVSHLWQEYSFWDKFPKAQYGTKCERKLYQTDTFPWTSCLSLPVSAL
jgi:hypothetical protein